MLQCDKKLTNLIDMYFYRQGFSILGNQLLLVDFYLLLTAEVEKTYKLQLRLQTLVICA